MRITIEVSDLTPAQRDWVRDHFRPGSVEPGQVKACVTLNYGGEFGENVKHVEMAVTEWLLTLGELVRAERSVMALLTPDALPDVVPPFRRTPAPLNDIYAAESYKTWPNY